MLVALEITPRSRDVPSPKSTVTLVIGCGGVAAGVTVNDNGTPTDPVVVDAESEMVGKARFTTKAIDAVPRWELRSVAAAERSAN